MGNTLWDDFRLYVWHSGNVLYKLIAINLAVFILFGLVWVIQSLLALPVDIQGAGKYWLSVPSYLPHIPLRIWSLVTYQFIHFNFFHVLFNMLILLFAGRIFREFLGDAKLLNTYLLGGLAGAAVFILAMQVFPLFRDMRPVLMGASASVMAVLAGIGTLLPNYVVRLILIGNVRLIYIVVVLALVDLLSLAGQNAGGHFAHLGGLAWGFFYIRSLQSGRDPGAWLTKLLDRLSGIGRGKSSSLKARSYGQPPAPAARQESRAGVSQQEVDVILDKIAKSGYDSLSQKEKDILFRASNEP